jgi:LPXTG-motif cell wall-anchored protein
MGIRLILVLMVGLLLVPAAAFAQENEDNICYVDPTAPECADEVIDRAKEQPTDEPSVLGVTLDRGLPVTGTQLTAIVALGGLLLAVGGALVITARRRGRSATRV